LKKNLIKSWVVLSLLTSSTLAEEATSGNLLPNAGTGTTTYQDSSGTIDGINGSTGWTTTGITDFGSELEVNGTGSVSANGSLLGIDTTKATDGASFTTTADSLDGGVRLNSTTEVQNCEWSGSAYRCGNAQAGQDSYSTTVTILDDNNQELSKVTQIRNTDAGYYGNTFTYTDTVIYTGTGSRNWSWEWAGTNVANPNTTSADGPNLLGAELTATLLDIQYSALPTTTQNELQTFEESTSKEFAKIEENLKVEEKFNFEESKFGYEEPVKTETKAFEEEPLPSGTSQTESLSGPGATSTETSEPSGEKTGAPLSQAEDSQDPQEPQTAEEEPSSLQAEQKSNEEEGTEKETSTEKEQTTEAASDSKSNVSGEKKSISLAKSMEKIDAEVKDIGKNLKLKNLVKIKLMSDNSVLESYANIKFYKPKNIYLDQIDIRDNRVLYANASLVSYQQKDPLFQAQKELFEIRQEKQKLIREIEILKNVR